MLSQPRMYKKRQKSMAWHLEISLRDSNLNLQFSGWLHPSHWGETVILSFWKWGISNENDKNKYSSFRRSLTIQKKTLYIYSLDYCQLWGKDNPSIVELWVSDSTIYLRILICISASFYQSYLLRLTFYLLRLTFYLLRLNHRRPLGCHDTMGIGKPNKLRGQTVRDVAMAEN